MADCAYDVYSSEQATRMTETAADTAPAPVVALQPLKPDDYANRMRWLPRIIPLFKREPALAITLSYLLVGAIGLWSSYWYYREFGIPILEYYQVGDFLVAGLRDPFNFFALLLMGSVAFIAYGAAWYEIQNPEKVATLRERWWGRIIFMQYSSPFRQRRWHDISPEATVLLALLLGGGSMMMSHADARADVLKRGEGTPLKITLMGSDAPLQGEARLIGTSSTHLFLYWPANGRTEILAHEAIARIERLPRARASAADLAQ